MLVETAKALGGVETKYGDLSVTIPALPKIPITYIIWKGDDELPASSMLLFDASASHYLPTEDIAVLGELTTARLMISLKKIVSNRHLPVRLENKNINYSNFMKFASYHLKMEDE